VQELSLKEKVDLLTGADSFTLPALARIGLRALRTSDGPAGVRGTNMDPADRSTSFPAPIALAATWDADLVEELTAQLGREARAKGIDVLLAPTVNLARTPYGGRGFECFGEDPLLAARIAAAYVRGVQSRKVAVCVKHFVGNDSETDRWTADVRMDEATMREVYLPPFEACVVEGGALAVMAGYNSVGGVSMTEHAHLLDGVLKQEWGFQGTVFSDWSAARSTEESALAGLDLVMPGPAGPWGAALVAAVEAGRVPEVLVNDKVNRLLRLAEFCGALGAAEQSPAPRQGPHVDRITVRRAAARSFTLLRNVSGTLPLPLPASGELGELALIGPNALHPVYQGSGSAEVGAAFAVGPAEGLRAVWDGATVVTVSEGCVHSDRTPAPDPGCTRAPDAAGEDAPEDAVPGARLEIFDEDESLVYSGIRPDCGLSFWDPLPPQAAERARRLVLSTVYTAPADGTYRFAVAGLGTLGLELDGVEAAAAYAQPPSDVMVAFSRPFETGSERELAAGQRIRVTVSTEPGASPAGFVRFRLAAQRVRTAEELLAEAVAAAERADAAVVVVGTAPGDESEGFDRETLALPGPQDELVERVAAVCPRTVVVVNSGMPVLMPWADRVGAILQVWFPGQEFGHALADVLSGAREPGGRLPVSLPRAESLVPVGQALPKDGVLSYDEGVHVGYRGYARSGMSALFPFGHGLGYTEWEYEELELPIGPVRAGADIELAVTVRNVGTRPGSEVVQVYLTRPFDRLTALAAFGRAEAEPGGLCRVRLTLPARVFAHWDDASHAWTHPAGVYVLRAGRSSRELPLHRELPVS
jgi:beta-glucosidase